VLAVIGIARRRLVGVAVWAARQVIEVTVCWGESVKRIMYVIRK